MLQSIIPRRADEVAATITHGLAPAAIPAAVSAEARSRCEASVRASAPAPIARVILAEPLFERALVRERKRADRFEGLFVLLTVSAEGCATGPLVHTVAAATRQTDIIGWTKQGTTLGVIFADLAEPADEIAQRLETRVLRELELAGDAAGDTPAVRLYVHQHPRAQGISGLAQNDPLLEHLEALREARQWLDALRRTLDVVGSLFLLIVLSPLFALVAALVKLTSSGPVLFQQERIGYLAKPFTMLKFRTMQPAADERLHQQFVTDFIRTNSREAVERKAGRLFKIEHDPRVTAVGRLLRRSSLDELPQLWNVLRGEMSLVGPRPPLRYELEQYRPWHWRRVLEGKPGITGLWQVVGRSRTSFDEMVRLDLHYVRTRSLWTDVRILLATPRAVITGKGAC